MRTGPRFAAIIVLFAACVAVMGVGGPAFAATSGGCRVLVGGIPTDQAQTPARALEVDANAPLPITGGPTSGVTFNGLELQLAGVTFYRSPVFPIHADKPWASVLQVEKLSKVGVGIFRFTDHVYGPGGCIRSAFVRLSGKSPFVTVTGALALLAILAGIAVAFVPIRRTRLVREAALSSLFNGERVRWRFRPSGLGAMAGFLVAGGVLGLLQGFSVVYLTPVLLIGGLVLGLVVGSAYPAPLHRSAVRAAVREYGQEQQ